MTSSGVGLKQSLSEAHSILGCATASESRCPPRAQDGRVVLGLWLSDAHVGKIDGRISLHGEVYVPQKCPNIPAAGDLVHVAYQKIDQTLTPPEIRAQASPELWRVIGSTAQDDNQLCLLIVVSDESSGPSN